MFAELTNTVLRYCSPDLSQQELQVLAERVQAGLAVSGVDLEEAAEAISAAVTAAARKLPGGSDVSPNVAVALLWQLTHAQASERTAAAVEVSFLPG